jgi:hypothetical protein
MRPVKRSRMGIWFVDLNRQELVKTPLRARYTGLGPGRLATVRMLLSSFISLTVSRSPPGVPTGPSKRGHE